jgi:outer membrane protein assembly factor BamB
VDSSPVIAGSRAYVGSADGRVYAFDLADGRPAGEFEAGGPITASPALAGGRLVIGTQDGQLFCLGPKA